MNDTVCLCNHWYEEHGDDCCDRCDCPEFEFSAEHNTSEAIAARTPVPLAHYDECKCALCFMRNVLGPALDTSS